MNATGSNPTLLLHSPAVTFTAIAVPPAPALVPVPVPAPHQQAMRLSTDTRTADAPTAGGANTAGGEHDVSPHAVSPPGVLWAHGYPFSPSESHPHGGVQTADGGFLVVGDGVDYTLPPTSAVKRRIYVLRIDKHGTVLWQHRVGDLDFNYGKFGIELRDGRILVAGAISEMDSELQLPVLKRALVLFSGNGTLLQQLTLPNAGKQTLQRDGFMCVSQGPGQQVVATGFVGGDNYTKGYVDEPMFLIGGGRVAVNTFDLAPPAAGAAATTATTAATIISAGSALSGGAALTVVGDAVLDDSGKPYTAVQGMRLFYDSAKEGYVVSHTVSVADGAAFQFGMSFIQVATRTSPPHAGAAPPTAAAATVTLKWMNAYWATLPMLTPTGAGQ